MKDVEDIKCSKEKDNIVILLKDGTLYKNGILIYNEIKKLDKTNIFSDLFAIGRTNTINFLGHDNDNFVYNNGYNYKSILSTPKYTVLLTNERTIKLFDFKIEKFDRLKKYLVNELKN